ncbi:MAG: hypothetical protein A07HN63_00194 [uncultured archaeon A07HN63]|jgi:hypothetical protein|nr:MAG: hypothetical protein A07HN63_00194 [uncultured archaeon A07HN63]
MSQTTEPHNRTLTTEPYSRALTAFYTTAQQQAVRTDESGSDSTTTTRTEQLKQQADETLATMLEKQSIEGLLREQMAAVEDR